MPQKGKKIWEQLMQLANEYHANGKSFDEISKILSADYKDEAMIYAIIKKLKAEHYAIRLKEGKKLLLIGSSLMFAGFFITCINFHANQSINFAMYGLTTLGLIFAFAGLYKIF